MDRRLREVPPEKRITLQFEGNEITAQEGDSVAVALFASGEAVLSRSIKYHRPRSFFCLAGHCGACLMRIDGKPNVRACKTPVKEGLRVERQNAFPTGAFDVLGAADFFFPKGMDHHTMMTSPRALNAVLNKVVRQLEGDFPIRIEGETLLAAGRAMNGPELGTMFIRPNPERADRYVVVVEGVNALGTLRSLSLPDLVPDFVVYD